MRSLKKFLAQSSLLLLFLASSSAFIVFSKLKITSYMLQIQNYASQVYSLKDIAATPEGIAQLQELLAAIKPIVQKATLFTYALVPAVLLLLWVVFVGTYFLISVKPSKGKYWQYMLKFTALSALPMIASEYIALRMLQTANDFLLTGTGLPAIFLQGLLLLLIGCLAFVAYVLAADNSLLQTISKAMKLLARKIHVLLPLFILLGIIAAALLSAVLSTYLSISSGNINMATMAYNIAVLIIASSAAVLLNNFIIKIITKNAHSL